MTTVQIVHAPIVDPVQEIRLRSSDGYIDIYNYDGHIEMRTFDDEESVCRSTYQFSEQSIEDLIDGLLKLKEQMKNG